MTDYGGKIGEIVHELCRFRRCPDHRIARHGAFAANSHGNTDTIRRLRKNSVLVLVIAKETTMYLKVIDISAFSVFKQHYYKRCGGRMDRCDWPPEHVKLTASQSRILCTRLTKSA